MFKPKRITVKSIVASKRQYGYGKYDSIQIDSIPYRTVYPEMWTASYYCLPVKNIIQYIYFRLYKAMWKQYDKVIGLMCQYFWRKGLLKDGEVLCFKNIYKNLRGGKTDGR